MLPYRARSSCLRTSTSVTSGAPCACPYSISSRSASLLSVSPGGTNESDEADGVLGDDPNDGESCPACAPGDPTFPLRPFPLEPPPSFVAVTSPLCSEEAVGDAAEDDGGASGTIAARPPSTAITLWYPSAIAMAAACVAALPWVEMNTMVSRSDGGLACGPSRARSLHCVALFRSTCASSSTGIRTISRRLEMPSSSG